MFFETMSGFCLETKFDDLPDDYECYLGPADMVVQLAFFVGRLGGSESRLS